MTRFTVSRLRHEIRQINGYLEQEGSDKRLETGGRNGYQAVDQYSVDADGERTNSGIDRNVECGTSRECAEAAWTWYRIESNRIERNKDKQKIAALELSSTDRTAVIAGLIDRFGAASILEEIGTYLRQRAETLKSEPLEIDSAFCEQLADGLQSLQPTARSIQN